MIDWTKSMQVSYMFYKVDPVSWLDTERITTVKRCSITNDLEANTLGSATFSLGEEIEECYVRVYLVATQNGMTEMVPLGTRLIMTPRTKFNGKSFTVDMDGYTPLIELQEKLPPLGYTVMKTEKILDLGYRLIQENTRAPIIKPIDMTEVLYDNFVANTDDNWLSYIKDLIGMTNSQIDIDEMGIISFAPIQDFESLQPRAVFRDNEISILYPDIDSEDDLYGIPNVLEVSFSNSNGYELVRVVNDDPTSPTSTVQRGREIHYRETSPKISGNPTKEQLQEYAEQLLKNLSTVKKTITFEHGYRPLRIGDAIILDYERAGFINTKAVIIRQTINCDKACKIQETVAYTKQLWNGTPIKNNLFDTYPELEIEDPDYEPGSEIITE